MNTMATKIAFICVNYNDSAITCKYITNILMLKSNFTIKIIIVDNNSNNEDKLRLSDFIIKLNLDNVIVLNSEINLGYFKGLNHGLLFAQEKYNINYFIIGNNDLNFDPNFLIELENSTFDSDVLVIAPDVYTKEGIHENPHILHKVSYFRKIMYKIYFTNYIIAYILSLIYKPKRRHKTYTTEPQNIYMGIGALYILTPFFFNFFTKLWDDVFLYGEEALLMGQLRSVNGKTLYLPNLKCLHYGSITTSKLKTRSKYKMEQNSYRIYSKYF
jgi:GT2 family glycosyltransferase